MRLLAGTSHWKRKEPELSNQRSLGSNLSRLLASCVTLDKSLSLSEVQFPIVREGDKVRPMAAFCLMNTSWQVRK